MALSIPLKVKVCLSWLNIRLVSKGKIVSWCYNCIVVVGNLEIEWSCTTVTFEFSLRLLNFENQLANGRSLLKFFIKLYWFSGVVDPSNAFPHLVFESVLFRFVSGKIGEPEFWRNISVIFGFNDSLDVVYNEYYDKLASKQNKCYSVLFGKD